VETEKYFGLAFLDFVCFKRGIFVLWYRRHGRLSHMMVATTAKILINNKKIWKRKEVKLN
jgi:hypothetical protein